MARDAPAEFVPLFHEAMARPDARPRLDAFIKSIGAGEADACAGAYFTASTDPAYHYSRRDRTSLAVFAALAYAAVDRGEPLYAVRFDALVHADKSPWQERFSALDPGQQGKLTTRAKQLRKALSRPQREILRMLPEVIRTGRSGEMEQYVDKKLHFRESHGCLLAYLEASLRYPSDNQRSLQVFAGLSVLTIRKGDSDFVKQYRSLITKPGTTWSRRWTALEKLYRDKVNEELASRRVKVQLIESGTAAGTVPVSMVTPAPDRLRADITRRDASRPTSISRAFLALFDTYMTPGGDAKAKRHALTEFIFARKLPELRECLAAYLEASTRYPANDPQSLDTFWGIASLLINRGKAYEARKLDLLKNTPNTLVAQRFAALPKGRRTTLEGEIATLSDPRTRLILDDLKFEYYKRHRADADLTALRSFEADVDPSHRDAVRGVARDCERTYHRRDTKAFAKSFDAWTDLVHAQTDSVVLVTMLKWCRELDEITPALRSELYWYGVLALQVAALVRYPEVYDRGLSPEDKEFFLHRLLVPQGYRYDFEQRLEFAWWKRAAKPPDSKEQAELIWQKRLAPKAEKAKHSDENRMQLRDVSRAHAMLLYLAQRRGFTLVPMDHAELIRQKLLALKAEKSKDFDDIRIPISSRFPDESLTLGATVGDLYIVWWDRKTNRAYVEMDGCGRVLFEVDSYLKLGQLHREDQTYGQIWRDTQHLLVVIPFFFQVMGYLPDLVTGGFAGLVNSVLTDMMVDVFAEQAGLGDKGTMLLSFAANLYTGHMLDRMRDSTGTRVLLDVDDVTVGRGTARQADIPVAPRERATGGAAKGIDVAGGGGGAPRALDEFETHGIARAADEPPPKAQPRGDEHGGKPRGEEARGGEELEEPKPEESGESGSFGDRDEGAGKASKKRSDPAKYNRLQGDERAQPTAGSTDRRGTRNTAVKGKGSSRGGDRGKGGGGKLNRAPPYDLITDNTHPLIEDLTREGWTFEKIPLKQPKSLGGAFHKSLGADFEWRITSPSGEHFDADFLANNPSASGILIGDAKATRVTDPKESGHIVFWSDKVEALGRATALSLESNGRMRVEIVCNVNAVSGEEILPMVGPEAYLNMVNQQVAVELLERQGPALDRYYRERGKPAGYKPTRDEVQRLVGRQVEVSDWDWGKIGREKDPTPPTKRPPRGSGPRRN